MHLECASSFSGQARLESSYVPDACHAHSPPQRTSSQAVVANPLPKAVCCRADDGPLCSRSCACTKTFALPARSPAWIKHTPGWQYPVHIPQTTPPDRSSKITLRKQPQLAVAHACMQRRPCLTNIAPCSTPSCNAYQHAGCRLSPVSRQPRLGQQ